jgi:hypothetical protein
MHHTTQPQPTQLDAITSPIGAPTINQSSRSTYLSYFGWVHACTCSRYPTHSSSAAGFPRSTWFVICLPKTWRLFGVRHIICALALLMPAKSKLFGHVAATGLSPQLLRRPRLTKPNLRQAMEPSMRQNRLPRVSRATT